MIWTILIASFLGALSLSLLVFFVRVLFAPLTEIALSWWRGRAESRRESSLAALDDAIDHARASEFVTALRRAFILSNPNFDKGPDYSTAHNLKVLERVVRFSRKQGTPLKTLPRAESFIEERGKIISELRDTVIAESTINKTRREKGKSYPNWASKEFEGKKKRLQAELDETRAALERALNELLDEILSRSSSTNSEMTVH